MELRIVFLTNLYSFIILGIIFTQSKKHFDRDFLNDVLFRYLIILTGLMLVVDVLSRFDGEPMEIYNKINRLGNFMIFLTSPVLPSLWLTYSHYLIFEDRSKTKKLFLPLGMFNAVNVFFLLATQLTGWYYTIDGNNIYHFGPFYPLYIFFILGLVIISTIIIGLNRDKIKRKKYYSLAFFMLPSLGAMILLSVFYGTTLILHGVVISLLVLFLELQNNDLSMDYLTKVYNRKKVDSYLKKKILEADHGKSFSAMILDINHFKQINDRYGHEEGDRALQTAARLLRDIVGHSGVVGRFGGDEFYVIFDDLDSTELEAMAQKIKQGMEDYHKTSADKFYLEFSMGYSQYDPKEKMGIDGFQKKIDALMYQNKNEQRKKSGEMTFYKESDHDIVMGEEEIF